MMSKRKFSSAAVKKGFSENRRKDHIVFILSDEDGDNTRIHTKISHGGGDDISDSLVSKMYKELCFPTKEDFRRFVECKLSENDYRELLKNS
ncbi:MAG: hypothetical protein Q4Q53_08995 [Methanocorpusculum sp.]|nr:hypothetical protein [Methanocorpusculum sp.]